MRVTSVQCHMKVFNTRQREDRSVHYKTKTACSLLVVFLRESHKMTVFLLDAEYSFRWTKPNRNFAHLSQIVPTGILGSQEWFRANKTKLFCFVAELDGDDCTSPTRSLRDTTTQDTDEPEIQHVSEPEKSAQLCPFLRESWASFLGSCVRVRIIKKRKQVDTSRDYCNDTPKRSVHAEGGAVSIKHRRYT